MVYTKSFLFLKLTRSLLQMLYSSYTYKNLKSPRPHEKTKNIKRLDLLIKNWKLRAWCSLFHFFHVICKISNFNMWTAKHWAQASCTYWVDFTKEIFSRGVIFVIFRNWLMCTSYYAVVITNLFMLVYTRVNFRISWQSQKWSWKNIFNKISFTLEWYELCLLAKWITQKVISLAQRISIGQLIFWLTPNVSVF